MKKLIPLLLLVLLSGVVVRAQDSKAYVRHGTGAPSFCTLGTVYVDDATGNVYANRLGACQIVGSSLAFSSPTTNRLAKFASATSLSNSLLSDDGTNVHSGSPDFGGASGTFFSAVNPSTDTTSSFLHTLLNGDAKRALFAQSVWTNSAAPASTLVGAKFVTETHHTTGTAGFVYGELVETTASGAGNITHLIGINTSGIGASSATVDNYYGIRINAPTFISSANITQKVAGIQIEDMSYRAWTAPLVYNIYSKGATSINKFEGKVDALTYSLNGTAVTIGTTFSTGVTAGVANNAATTAYQPFNFMPSATFATASSSWSATESGKQTLVTHACTLKNFFFITNSAQDASGSQVLTVRVNGVDTSITVTIAANGAVGTYSDTTHTASVPAGGLVSLKSVNNAGLAGAALVQWAIDCQ